MEHGNGNSPSAPYVGWTPFKSCVLEGLTNVALPNTINRSVFVGQSGGVQGQLVNAVKFLGLSDDKGKPTKALEDLLVDDDEARKRVLAAVLRASYPEVFALGIERTTLPELGETIADSYGISGETREKAVRFFIAAAQYAGVQLSPYIIKSGAAANGRRKARRARTADPTPTASSSASYAPTTPATSTTPATPTSGQQRTVSLVSGGGSMTLSVSVDPFRLNSEDRAFVFKVIDLLTEYEETHKSSRNEGQRDEVGAGDDEDDNPFGA